MSMGKLNRIQRSTRRRRTKSENHRPVTVAHIPLCALDGFDRRRLGEAVLPSYHAVLSHAPFRTPPTVRKSVTERNIEPRPIRACLSAADNFLDHSLFRRAFIFVVKQEFRNVM